jgi:hypothetical protein
MEETGGEDKLYSMLARVWFVFFIDDCNWPEVPTRTRNDRNQLLVDMQMHLVDHWMTPRHNYIDLLLLE